jgi:RNA polymerase sigma-70 factor (ECF subfamily)
MFGALPRSWSLLRSGEWSHLGFLGSILRAVSTPEGWGGGQAPRVPPRKPEFDEQALIAAAQRGSLPAFNQLILHYQGLAYNVAYRLLGDADSAADATQDGFIKAFQKLNQYRGGSFKAWMLRIITNTCYDTLRARKRRPTSSLEPEDEDSDSEHDGRLLDPAERPDAYVLRQELASVIQSAIELLPPDQRTALVLADIEGLDYEEIAEATNSALGTVKSRLSRARAKMRDMLMAQKELLPAQYRLNDGLR